MTGERNIKPIDHYSMAVLEGLMPGADWIFPVPYASNPTKSVSSILLPEKYASSKYESLQSDGVFKITLPESLIPVRARDRRGKAREEVTRERAVLESLKSDLEERAQSLGEQLHISIPKIYDAIHEEHYDAIRSQVENKVERSLVPPSVLSDLESEPATGFIRQTIVGRKVRHLRDLDESYLEHLIEDITRLHEWGYAGFNLISTPLIESEDGASTYPGRIMISERGVFDSNLTLSKSPWTGEMSYHPVEFSGIVRELDDADHELARMIDQNHLNSLNNLAKIYRSSIGKTTDS